jgi:hypothetical protein
MFKSLARLASLPRVTLVGLALLGSLHQAGAQGTAFDYSGVLDDNGGFATGVYDFTFSLSSSSNEVMQVGATITNFAVPVTDGTFTVALDFGAGVFTGNPLWVEIGVRTNGAANFNLLNPLQPVLPVPYAVMAEAASNLLGTLPASQLTGIVSMAQLPGAVVTNNESNLSLSGAFSGNGAGLTNLNAANSGLATTTQLTTTSNGILTVAATAFEAANSNLGNVAGNWTINAAGQVTNTSLVVFTNTFGSLLITSNGWFWVGTNGNTAYSSNGVLGASSIQGTGPGAVTLTAASGLNIVSTGGTTNANSPFYLGGGQVFALVPGGNMAFTTNGSAPNQTLTLAASGSTGVTSVDGLSGAVTGVLTNNNAGAVNLTNTANLFVGNGAGLTGLNAANSGLATTTQLTTTSNGILTAAATAFQPANSNLGNVAGNWTINTAGQVTNTSLVVFTNTFGSLLITSNGWFWVGTNGTTAYSSNGVLGASSIQGTGSGVATLTAASGLNIVSTGGTTNTNSPLYLGGGQVFALVPGGNMAFTTNGSAPNQTLTLAASGSTGVASVDGLSGAVTGVLTNNNALAVSLANTFALGGGQVYPITPGANIIFTTNGTAPNQTVAIASSGGGAGGAQTPLTNNVNGAGYGITNLLDIILGNIFTLTANGFTNTASGSTAYLFGANSSVNASNIVSSTLNAGTITGTGSANTIYGSVTGGLTLAPANGLTTNLGTLYNTNIVTTMSGFGASQIAVYNCATNTPTNSWGDFTAGPILVASSSGVLVMTNSWLYNPGAGTNEAVAVTFTPFLSANGTTLLETWANPYTVVFTNFAGTTGFKAPTDTLSLILGAAGWTALGYQTGTTGWSVYITNSSTAASRFTAKGSFLNL